jgi:uncharacterized protein YdcH (DUF465 family)
MEDRKIKEILIEKNGTFKRLFLEHQELEEKLQLHMQNKFKNEEERIEEKNIKKKKLMLKDAMQKHICEFKKKLN